MKKISRKFISNFLISSSIYYLFLIIETISLYFNEFGFDITNGLLTSFSQITSVINFGVFISFILTTASLQKEKIPVSKIFTFGLVISLFFGGLNFFLSNSVVPELRLISFLNRYENARNEPFSAQERADKAKEFKKSSADMMSNVLIKKYSDSLKNENKSQRNSISDLFQKIPDSIMESEFSEKELAEYGISKNKFTSDFNRRDLFSLKSEIRINELSVKKLKKIDWKKNERYINSFLVIFLVCFGIIIGANFRKQLIFSLACIGILTYSQILTLQIALADYLVNDDNVIGLIFKFAIIMIVFLYLVFKMQTDKNTGANNVYNS